MKTIKQLKDKLKELNAEFQEDKYPDGDGAIICVAPDGKQWTSGQCIHLTEPYGSHFSVMRQEAINDAFERISEGLEELDEDLNP